MNREDTKTRSIETELRSDPATNFRVPSVNDGIERIIYYRLRVLVSRLRWSSVERLACLSDFTLLMLEGRQ